MAETEAGTVYRPKLPELEFVRYRVEDRIATITLDRPDKLNAITDQVIREVRLAFQHFDLDPDAFVGILHGEGRAFTSGADVRQRQMRSAEEMQAFGPAAPAAAAAATSAATISRSAVSSSAAGRYRSSTASSARSDAAASARPASR